jgi:hypothetical protein
MAGLRTVKSSLSPDLGHVDELAEMITAPAR